MGEAATEVITAEYAEYAERRAARFGIPRIPHSAVEKSSEE
jgi:hypothetical protein